LRAGHAHAAALQQDEATVKNIRLWDPRPLIDTYRQLQEIRTYYDFRDVDIDRYWIEGKYTEVMLSPREMNLDQLPDTAQTWVNQHLKFTHGTGLAMSPVNKKDTEGLPVFYIRIYRQCPTSGLRLNSLPCISARRATTTQSSIRRRRVRLSQGRRQRLFVLHGIGRRPRLGTSAAAAVQHLLQGHQLASHREYRGQEQDHDSAQYRGPNRIHRTVPES